jgi:alpha-tubulin suppressor-like RCC1 family protein
MSYSNFYNFREINKALESLTTRVTNVEGKIIRDGLTVNTLNVDTSLNLTGDTVISGDVTIDNSNGLQVKSGMSVFNNTLTVDTLLKTFFGSSVDADGYYIQKVASGGRHNAVIITNGVKSFLFTFGQNDYGQLGNNTNPNNKNTPQYINLGGGIITDVDCGSSHTAMMVDGELYVCGFNDFGQLGTGDEDQRNEPTRVQIPGAISIVKAVCGGNHTVVIYKKSDNKNYAVSMGNNLRGQLGQNNILNNHITQPTPVVDGSNVELSDIRDVVCGESFTLFVVDNSSGSGGDILYGCGDNQKGQLGMGLNTSGNRIVDEYEYAYPIRTYANGITNIQAGANFTYLLESNNLYSVGDNASGQLARTLGGTDTFSSEFDLTTVINPTDFIYFSCGRDHIAAFKNDKVILVGSNLDGRIGVDNTTSTDTTNILELDFVSPIATAFNLVSCGGQHTMIVFDSLVLCGFGENTSGQLGNGSNTSTYQPQFVSATEIAENANVNVTGNFAVSGTTTVYGSLHVDGVGVAPVNITQKLNDIITQLGDITTRLDALEAFHP